MEKHQYVLKPSLKQMALTNVAIMLWNQDDILSSVGKFRWKDPGYFSQNRLADRLIKKVKEKVPVLLLPDSLKEELIHLISPIGLEIIRWKVHHSSLRSDVTDELNQLCWTSRGTVDYAKMAKRLIRQERVGNYDRYELACRNCLEEDIRAIWGKFPEDYKKLFYLNGSTSKRDDDLVTFWAHFLNGDSGMLHDLFDLRDYEPERIGQYFRYAFESAALNGNKAATEYFFQQLTSEEREASLMKTAQQIVNGFYTDRLEFQRDDLPLQNLGSVAIYLLSQMSKEEQMELFKKYPEKTLWYFLDWPWQDIFMKVAGLMWLFLPLNAYEWMLNHFCNSFRKPAFNHMKLFGDFFLQAPSDYRIGILNDHLICSNLIGSVANTNNRECIKLVLRNVANAEKERFITSFRGLDVCGRLLSKGDWFLLKLFVEECTISPETKIRLKEKFTDFNREFRVKHANCELEKFFQMIDNVNVRVCNKRCLEESEGEVQPTLPKKALKETPNK